MKRPSFQFYPADWLADMQLRMLPWASKGLYMDLLCYCWREGWIPADSSAIAQLCGCHDLAIVEPCLQLFQPHPEDASKLIHKRLVEEKLKQDEHSQERSDSGKKGAEARWGKGKPRKKKSRKFLGSSANSSAIGLATDQPMAENGSSSSTSSSNNNTPLPPSVEPQSIVPLCTIEQAVGYAPMARLTEAEARHWWHTRNASGWTKSAAGGGAPRKIGSWQSDMAASAPWVREAAAKSKTAQTADGKAFTPLFPGHRPDK